MQGLSKSQDSAYSMDLFLCPLIYFSFSLFPNQIILLL